MSQNAWQGRNPPPEIVNDGFPGWYGNEKPTKPTDPKPYAALPPAASVQDFRNALGLLQTKVKELDSEMRTFVQQTERMQRLEVTVRQFIDKHNLEMESIMGMIERELGPVEEPETNTDIAEELAIEIGPEGPEEQDDNGD